MSKIRHQISRFFSWLRADNLPPLQKIETSTVRVPLTVLTILLALILPTSFTEESMSSDLFWPVMLVNLLGLLFMAGLLYALYKGHTRFATFGAQTTLLFVTIGFAGAVLPYYDWGNGYVLAGVLLQLMIVAVVASWSTYWKIILANVIGFMVVVIPAKSWTFDPILISNIVEILAISLMPIGITFMVQEFKRLLTTLEFQKQATEDEKDKLDSVIKGMSDAVLLVDKQGMLTALNDAAKSLFPFPIHERDKLHYLDHIHMVNEKSPDKRIDPIRESLSSHKPQDLFSGVSMRDPDGELVAVAVSINPIPNDALIVLIRDVTTQREIEQMKSDFVSVASHQLRTPLTAIKWMTELLKERITDPDDEVRDMLEELNTSTQRTIKLVGFLLDVSRIERNKDLELQLQETKIKDIIDIAVHENEQKRESKGTNLSLDIDDVAVKVDKDKIIEVISNLYNNAIKYSDNNSHVEIKAKVNEDRVIITVSDNGIGIPDHQQKHIFEKFFRSENAVSFHREGNGLGLYFAKALIEVHGGTITFESAQDEGTKFIIDLPIHTKE